MEGDLPPAQPNNVALIKSIEAREFSCSLPHPSTTLFRLSSILRTLSTHSSPSTPPPIILHSSKIKPMGQLSAECFAQGSDNSLYALAFGFDLSNGNALVALLKSSVSPPSPSALTWSVVSTVAKAELFSFESDVYMTKCLVDPNGAFIAWNYGAYRTGPGASAPSRPGGFRYDPSLSTSSTTTTGKGGWVNIETSLSYPWTSTSAASSLFYLKDSSGKYNVYHAFMPGSIGTTFKFGALNIASTPNMMESSNTSWSVSVSFPMSLRILFTQFLLARDLRLFPSSNARN